MARYIVGAYAASPCKDGWDPELEGRYFAALDEAGIASGLELPFVGTLHANDPDWLIRNIRPHWSIVLTEIPGTMGRLGKDAEFGLASSSEAGRTRAVEFSAATREAVDRLHQGLGRRAVTAVEIHSAPRPAASAEPSAEAFRRSLDTLRSWDWQGAALSVEHCDRFVPGQKPEKGFLSIDAEIAAIRGSQGGTPIGLSVNWGRSAIEARDAGVPLLHLKQAKDEGVLNGLIFSGAAAKDPVYGDWTDKHAPFAAGEGEGGLLLTPARAKECLAAVKGAKLAFLGFKVQPMPKDLTVEQRIEVFKKTAAILDAQGAA